MLGEPQRDITPEKATQIIKETSKKFFHRTQTQKSQKWKTQKWKPTSSLMEPNNSSQNPSDS